MTEHLAEAGWEVDIITASPPGTDKSSASWPSVRINHIKAPAWLGGTVSALGRLKRRLGRNKSPRHDPSPTRLDEAKPGGRREVDGRPGRRVYDRLMPNLAALLRWNDELGWARRAVRLGLGIARSRPPSVVAVSSPPHPTHLAGIRLTRALRVPYLADFRDPWILREAPDVHATAVDLRLGRRARNRVFRAATRTVFNTAWAAAAAERQEPDLVGRTTVIPNGYDPLPEIGSPDPELFRVVFVGWLYDFMDPEPVLAGCARLRERIGLDSLRIEFVGTDSAPGGVSLRSRARAHGLDRHFEHRPRISRDEALRTQERAAVQVVFDYPSPFRVPMKFYDGVQMRGDLLLIGQPHSALADVAGRVGCRVCRPDDREAIDRVLDRASDRWRSGDYAQPIDRTGMFARHNTTRRMAELVEELAGS